MYPHVPAFGEDDRRDSRSGWSGGRSSPVGLVLLWIAALAYREHHDAGHVHFDGIETFNPSFAGRQTSDEATALADNLGLAHVGGSDSHCLETIGTALTLFPGHTWAQLRQAIAERSTRVEGEFWNLSTYTSIAVPQAFRSLVLLPGKRVRKMVGWFLADRGIGIEMPGTR